MAALLAALNVRALREGGALTCSWLRMRELVRKEFIQLFRDRKNRPLLVIAPLIQMILFGYVVSTDVRDIRVALIDQARTPESRRLIDAFDGNPIFRITHVLDRPPGAGPAAARAPGRHRAADPARLQRAHPARGDGRGADDRGRQHEQHGRRAHRLRDRRPRRLQRAAPAGALPRADRLRGDRRPGPHLVQPEPRQPALLRPRDRRLPRHADLAAVHLHGRHAREGGRHHGAADRDARCGRASSSSARPSPSS